MVSKSFIAGVFGCVNRPANRRSFMAVGALDQRLGVADFSAHDTAAKPETSVDISAPGAGLWQRIVANAKTLPDACVDVGRGVVMSP